MTLETMSYNVEKVKSLDFDWFQRLIEGYVEGGITPKPTPTAIKKQWEKLTGQKIKTK